MKYNTYHKEKSKVWKTNIGKIDNWTFDQDEDSWTCKADQKLHLRYESKEITEIGYELCHRHYRSESCADCPLKSACTKTTGNREVKVSMEYLRYKNQAREMLRSEEGYGLSV